MGRRAFLKLWKLWYIIIVVVVYCFLIYHAIRRYIAFKTQVFDPRHGQAWDEGPMNCYLAVLITSLSLLPMLLYSGLMRIGNYANDGVVLGKDPETLNDALGETGITKTPRMSLWQRFRRHFLPLAGILHATSAYLLLLPIPVLAAEQIRNEVYKKNRLWHSDLDFIFHPDSHHRNFTNKGQWVEVLPISPELCNYIFALLFLTVRYPATFWYTSRPMALLFCLAMLTADLHLIFENAAVSLLYKVSLNRAMVPGLRLLLPPAACLVLPAVGTSLLVIAHMTVFEYGYLQFLDNLRKYSQYFAAARDPFEFGPSEVAPARRGGPAACLTGYLPHLSALVMLVLIVCFKAPVAWELTQVFRATGDRLCLAAVVVEVLYLCFWIFAWLLFTVKSSWKFQINIPIHTISEISPQGGGAGSKLHPHDDGSPVYSCFHANLSAHDQSGTDCCSEHSSSKNSSSGGGGGTNYVFLQPSVPRPMIATISEHVDVVSESSYESRGGTGSGGPGSTDAADGSVDPGPPGLLKYAVRRGSTGQTSVGMGVGSTSSFGAGATGSLTRNGRLRKSGNRVTFKEEHETIPGSPLSEGEGSSQNTSSTSDSGIDHHQRAAGAGQQGPHRDSYAEPTYLNQADFANYHDVYGGPAGIQSALGQHALPPDVILEGASSMESSLHQHHLTSPYSSLTRPGRSLVGHMEDIEMHATGDPGDPQLCSQV